ncbi:Ubiquitin-conjugating enzyme E2 6 [Gnomoniopsis smithogilvyi]|uniref:Ubiquitin-conjugating enzyme E2 6 n=1 Tax=Gnomoniopsis smithogilvyi TaxID=1191159 RepID=A0A9W9CZE9_9PEZI|nr:Ubiquitin-conjugating enzyme E2 6 [Gnomoniopsis smithogilvyi]
MATKAAHKRLTREYQALQKEPTPYISAHPCESNILEWHYILTGPPDTPYHNGQYWGTLMFPPDYPFKPPAIRMHTPSGRFQPSTRLCLTISDFHPRSFNPAWSVSTILTGLLSFMTSNEITTGSISASTEERKLLSARSRWWNSTGGGSHDSSRVMQKGNNIKAGDGGKKFRAEFPEEDAENWKWIRENNVDIATGNKPHGTASCGPQLVGGIGGSGNQAQTVVDAVVQQREAGRGWVSRNKLLLAGGAIFIYVMVARLLGEGI